MGGRLVVAIAIACVACGRVGFGVHGDAAVGSDGDSSGDATALDCSQYLLCDDFEDSTFDPVWSVPTGVMLDETRAYRGQRSARAHLDAFGPNVEKNVGLTEIRTFTMFDPTELWIRAWVRLSDLPAGTNGLELVSLEQVTANEEGVYIFVHSDDTSIYTQFAPRTNSRMETLPTNQWVCLVLYVLRSTQGGGTMQLTSDRLLPLDLVATETDSSPPIREIGIGLQFASVNVDVPQPALDLWIDDVIIDDDEVTCTD